MDIQNRISDVVNLKCYVCQDFFRMIKKPDWQKKLYCVAQDAITSGYYKENYLGAYNKMRDYGVEKYSVEDMDVSLIYNVVLFTYKYDIVASINKPTRDALKSVKEDRNISGHANGNEDADELYLRALLSLCTLRTFIKTVDNEESSIEESARSEYRRKYIAEIEKLMGVIDEERIALIQRGKDIDRDIKKILQSPDPHRAWFETYESYEKRSRIDGNKDQIAEFNYRCSDAGIPYAHMFAVWSAGIKKDWDEYNKRLLIAYDRMNKDGDISAKDILDGINSYVFDNEESEAIRFILDDMKSHGYVIEKKPNGFYQLVMEPPQKQE